MFEVGMKQLALIIDVQRLDCTCWVSLVCVGNSTSVVGRILSSTWGLSSLLSASCRREITDFSEFSQFWWLHGCGVPICIAISLLERKIHLGQSKEKAKEFKNKELWQLYSEMWSEGKCFQALPNFLIQAVPFGEPRAGGNLQCFVCQQPMAPSPPLCDLFLIHWASGKAGAGNWAALGLFQFIKICCCHLDKGDLRREGNPLNSASSNSHSHHPWQHSCPQRELD